MAKLIVEGIDFANSKGLSHPHIVTDPEGRHFVYKGKFVDKGIHYQGIHDGKTINHYFSDSGAMNHKGMKAVHVKDEEHEYELKKKAGF